MMLLTKLKAVAVAVLVVVTGGLGALPVLVAADGPSGRPASGAKPSLGPNLTDEAFLRRVCLDLRGSGPSAVEMRYFVADADPAKRTKVVGWLTEDGRRLALYRRSDLKTGRVTWAVARPTQVALAEFQPSQVQERSDPPLTAVLEFDASPKGDWLGLTLTDEPQELVLDVGKDQPRNDFVADVELGVELGLTRLRLDKPHPTDEEFLRRTFLDLLGLPPTRIEREYFLADKDPNKRAKLLDLLLKDPEVARKVGEGWKQLMLGTTVHQLRLVDRLDQPGATATLRLTLTRDAARSNRFEPLLGQLLDGKRTDDQVLDALSAAVLGRLPTESERRLILAAVTKGPDKAAAWREVIAALGGTDEAKKHAEKK